MKFPGTALLIIFLALMSGSLPPVAAAMVLPDHGIVYLSPPPDAQYILPESNIIIRFDRTPGVPVDRLAALISVVGSKSGKHAGSIVVSDDDRTVIFQPERPFRFGERIAVRFSGTVSPDEGGGSAATSWSFSTAERPASSSPGGLRLMELSARTGTADLNEFTIAPLHADSLPAGFPAIQTTVYDTPSPGYLFLSNFKFGNPLSYDPFLMILDNAGEPVFYREMPDYCLDFKLQPNGLLTYFDNALHRYYALDSTYAVVDSFYMKNGYPTDLHELRILDNGHTLMMSYDNQYVDMSQVVAGGDSDAIVMGLIIQELDDAKNVVFQWRSWDHFQITDAININLLDSIIDYVHGNAIEMDSDGNILISCRHMSEITKISRTTGEIIWRLGGKNNEFTFTNDTLGFSYQHAIRRLPSGNVTLFDNGNWHSPKISRAVEYALDESTKTATIVWEYRNNPDIYGGAMGYVQRLPGGNTLIGWGAASTAVTEVKPDGSKIMELKYTSPGMYSYRAYRFEWEPAVVSVPPDVPQFAFLSQNYPNPFNGGTRMSFTLLRSSRVTLTIYDILGREVRRVINRERRTAGRYDINLDFRALSTGVYIARLTTGDVTQSMKMVYLP